MSGQYQTFNTQDLLKDEEGESEILTIGEARDPRSNEDPTCSKKVNKRVEKRVNDEKRL